METKIGFIGLGIMGSRMATNLQKHGYRLVLFNRTRSKTESLLVNGAEWDDVDEVDFCEVRVATLAESLRRAYEEPPAARARKAEAGVAVAHGRFTWEDTLTCVRRCLSELTGRGGAQDPASIAR